MQSTRVISVIADQHGTFDSVHIRRFVYKIGVVVLKTDTVNQLKIGKMVFNWLTVLRV